MERFAGIDVAKDTLEVFIRPDNVRGSFPNDEQGCMNLAGLLGKTEPCLVRLV